MVSGPALRPDEIKAAAAHRLRIRERRDEAVRDVDICDHTQRHFYVRDEESKRLTLVRLRLHQKAILRYPFLRGPDGHYLYSTVVLSAIKKAGKTALAAMIIRYLAETQTSRGEIYCTGNDRDQAKERSYKQLGDSLMFTPGAVHHQGNWILPQRWIWQRTQAECLTTGTTVKCIAVDPAGEAGANPDLTVWTELFGYVHEDARKFYVEMTPPPTKPDSIRLVESYAGYDGVSVLWQEVYETGMAGRQLTNGELAAAVCRPDVPGETYEDFLHAFAETKGDPDALVPIWLNEAAGQFTYWDADEAARRMPWQQGAAGERYYRAQAAQLPPNEFERLHLNHWVSDTGMFVPIEWWDDCQVPTSVLPPLLPGDQTPIVLAADAAVTGDCFGIVAVSRHPDPKLANTHVAVRAARKWDPKDSGGRIEFGGEGGPENFIRTMCKGGCIRFHPFTRDGAPSRPDDCAHCAEGRLIPGYNVKQLCYDEYQLADMAQRLKRDRVVWAEPFPQMKDRLISDSALRDVLANRQLIHNGDEEFGMADIRAHLMNANAKVQELEDSKIRIVKKSRVSKIDLVVCLSMGAYRCRYLRL